ncbi:hypothetical protein [Streptomyces litchfieldiae]|uniref:Integral membrane protein n=1 Tax=Streptomyces litchfieldiae TaxID=3075543 RepID=A0ABU2MR74_9ACTN|nr:hypothetical protein [Streptomyces sp. DSM 44938]MDT0344035.1 hypothetical protein [Streptomyces sp. DSM 44938]
MSKRHVQKMLREMAGGGPVEVTSAMATMKKLTRLAFIAQQFGYAYADIRQGGGPQGNGLIMLLVPDPSPQARERAERNRARYPQAGDGGSLPSLVPEEIELLKARISFDLAARTTDKQKTVIAGVGFTVLAVILGFRLGGDSTDLAIAGIVWVALMATLPGLLVINRRYKAKYAARLQAAGFTPMTDRSGRLRYVPPGGQLPGHGGRLA